MVLPIPDQPHAPACAAPAPPANASETALRDLTAGRELILPEIQETAEVSTRTVDTGTVRISKQIHEVQRTFQPTLHEQHIQVDRVPINRVVKTIPEVRTEGDTTVIPVVEEVVVKLILLKEELRVTRTTQAKPSQPQHVTLRREEIRIDREPSPGTDDSATRSPPR